MSDDDYKGDTPAKKAARVLFWENVLDHQGGWWPNKKYLVLAGEGGDIATMLALGCSPDAIVAYDLERSRVEECRARFPGVDIRHGNVADARIGQACSVIFLDFCSSFSEPLMDTVFGAVFHNGTKDTLVGIGTQRARERPSNSSHRRDLIAQGQKIARDRDDDDPRVNDPRVKLDGRTTLIALSLNRRRGPYVFCPYGEIRYQSSTKGKPGSPMSYSLLRCMRRDEFHVLGRKLIAKYSVITQLFGSFEQHESRLRWSVLKTLEDGLMSIERVALLYNVLPSTVVAWKAHATRGTYAFEEMEAYDWAARNGHGGERAVGAHSYRVKR